MAASTQGVELPSVIGTVLAEPPPPATYSLHPPTELQVPTSAKPDVAVYVVEPEAPSVAPTMKESESSVKEATEELVEPEEELPVDDCAPEVVNPLIS